MGSSDNELRFRCQLTARANTQKPLRSSLLRQATDALFCNSIEQDVIEKLKKWRQRAVEEENPSVHKRQKRRHTIRIRQDAASEVLKKNVIVVFIDGSEPFGRMSTEQ